MTRGYVFAAAGVVLVVNVAAVGSAVYNRSGAPIATLVLTERELALPPFDPENSGLWLELQWQRSTRNPSAAEMEARGRHDRAALESLGFDCSLPLSDAAARTHYRRVLPRTGFAVLEYDGESWRAYADAVSRGAYDPGAGVPAGRPTGPVTAEAVDRNRRQRLEGSRLIPIDAGVDPVALRRRYPDTSRFLIVPGVVGLGILDPTKDAPGRFVLLVEQVWPTVFHMPKEHRGPIEPLAREPRDPALEASAPAIHPPRYEVTVSYGRRYEPWITGVRPLPVSGLTGQR